MVTRRFLAAVVILAVSGCDVGPDYARPQTPSPAIWQEQTGAADWPSVTWWRGFRSPGLDRFMERAQQANFDIAAALARVRQADAAARIAGAALMPSIQAGGGRSGFLQPSGGNPDAARARIHSFEAALSASYELDFWGRVADAAAAARAVAEASRFDRETTALAVQAGVASTYLTILALRDRIKVAEGNLAIAGDTLDAIRARALAGTAAGLDIAQQESVVAEQRAAMPPLRQQLRQAGNALAILLGQLPEEIADPTATLEALTIPAAGAGLPSGLLARRPDVQFAEAQLVAANAQVKSAEAALFPQINLTAQGGVESGALSKLLNPGSAIYSLVASLAQPVFEGGRLEGGIELSQARYAELLQGYRKAVVSAFADVENALVAVDMGTRQEAEQRIAVDTAQRANDIARGQLFGGTIDVVALLNTQRTLFQAEDLRVQARLAHAQAVVALFKALGGGWVSEEGNHGSGSTTPVAR